MALSRISHYDPHIWLHTPLGLAECVGILVPDDSEGILYFHCWQDETQESWRWPNNLVRRAGCISHGRGDILYPPIYVDELLLEKLPPHILRHKKSPLHSRLKESCEPKKGDYDA